MLTGLIFLQAGGNQTGLINMGFILLMFAIFWLFIIRPQTKKQKAQSNFMNDLNKGDKVVTGSGILGKIVKIEDEVVTLEIDQKVNIRITKNAISKELTDAVYAVEKSDQKK
ncbi:MAG TPA: preprotein translocase subunit YajC [Bacteroidales bacterium]|nr:preprotein translocase subunit YajC [Bacteroidales bacterium]HKK77238.1 preprotein translocase subunit YajC [Saprospiraceae bacterium]